MLGDLDIHEDDDVEELDRIIDRPEWADVVPEPLLEPEVVGQPCCPTACLHSSFTYFPDAARAEPCPPCPCPSLNVNHLPPERPSS